MFSDNLETWSPNGEMCDSPFFPRAYTAFPYQAHLNSINLLQLMYLLWKSPKWLGFSQTSCLCILLGKTLLMIEELGEDEQSYWNDH